MPLYQFTCSDCQLSFEAFVSIGVTEHVCRCGSTAKKVFVPTRIMSINPVQEVCDVPGQGTILIKDGQKYFYPKKEVFGKEPTQERVRDEHHAMLIRDAEKRPLSKEEDRKASGNKTMV